MTQSQLLSADNPIQNIAAQISVNNLDQAVCFYEQAFGFCQPNHIEGVGKRSQGIRVLEHDGLPFLLVTQDNKQTLSNQAKNSREKTIITILCNKLEQVYERAITAGATAVQAPITLENGTRSCTVRGIEHYTWRFLDTTNTFSAMDFRRHSNLSH